MVANMAKVMMQDYLHATGSDTISGSNACTAITISVVIELTQSCYHSLQVSHRGGQVNILQHQKLPPISVEHVSHVIPCDLFHQLGGYKT